MTNNPSIPPLSPTLQPAIDPARGTPQPGTPGSGIRPDRRLDMDGRPLGPREDQIAEEVKARTDADRATRVPDDPEKQLYDQHTGQRLQTRDEQLLAESDAHKERDWATR